MPKRKLNFIQEQSTIKPGRECGKPPCRDFLHVWGTVLSSSLFPLPAQKEGADRLKLFQDKFSIYKKAGEPLYKTPKSVQECIELLKIAPDGIFEVAGNRYSKSYLFSDPKSAWSFTGGRINILEHCLVLTEVCIFWAG